MALGTLYLGTHFPNNISEMPKQDQAYHIIKKSILLNEYRPHSVLTEKDLCEKLKMSRTPIRYALSRLNSEGYLEYVMDRGLVVAPIHIADTLKVFEMRMVVEPFAASLTAERCSEDERQILSQCVAAHEKSFSDGDYYETVIFDSDFHYQIAEFCKNTYLSSSLFRLFEASQRFSIAMSTYKLDLPQVELGVEEHKRIMECITARDAKGTADAMASHLQNWQKYLINAQNNYYFLFE